MTEQLVCSGAIPAVPQNWKPRNSIMNHSTEEKKARNFVPWNKNRRKLSEFRSKPFRGRETNSEFRSVEQKKKQTLGILFRSMSQTKTHCQFCLLKQNFCKTNFFMSFRSVPSFGIDSSVNLGMPRNDHFLPRNNRNHSEYILRNFFERKSVANPISDIPISLLCSYPTIPYTGFSKYITEWVRWITRERAYPAIQWYMYEWRLSCTFDKSFAKFLIWED